MQIINYCSFSDWNTPLDTAPKCLKGKSLHKWILRNLKNRNRISCWELEENYKVCKTMMFLERIGKIKMDIVNHDYPYIGVKVC